MDEIRMETQAQQKAEVSSNVPNGKNEGSDTAAQPLQRVIRKTKNPSFLLKLAFVLAVHIWAVLASIHDFLKAQTFLFLLGLCWIIFLSPILGYYLSSLKNRAFISRIQELATHTLHHRWTSVIAFSSFATCLAIFLVIDTTSERSRLFGLVGITFFILLLTTFSYDRSKINWRTVAWGFFLQFCFGIVSLRWKWGSLKFQQFADLIVQFLELTSKGTEFVYGFLAKPPPICEMAPVFMFTALQVLVFFASVVTLLYYYGVIQYVLRRMAHIMQLTLGTTAVESLNACSCVFLGQAESALLIQPYLEKQTTSELHAIMTSGFSCIAGSLFAAYVSFGACPRYLLSSTIMSAPGSLACSKIMFPENEESQVRKVDDLELPQSEESSPLECISNGALAGMHLVIAISANLVAVLALLEFIDSVLIYLGELIGQGPWTLEILLGYVMFPVAFVMGVTGNVHETLHVARLIGTKTAVNEFVAYKKLGELISSKSQEISPRSAMIATYALCGFSNFCTIGITLGILGGLAPSKKSVLSRTISRALLTGCICCLYTATLAGIIVDEPILCRPSAVASTCFSTIDKVNRTFNE
ncbi:hypothetical protein Y032_0047g1434 [Ancylostoma ceylanicum]|uniref:Sodium/nucleoside cotransporter n=1 Tax=Ancylostoma ceylanicum TaxID=53326 RepID=A0A016UBM5_9BILA|nr:hypothetical protein Y032_0047g1434 [Ancylostoma ceylanicum]